MVAERHKVALLSLGARAGSPGDARSPLFPTNIFSVMFSKLGINVCCACLTFKSQKIESAAVFASGTTRMPEKEAMKNN